MAAAIGKPIPAVPLEQGDFYVIRDLLASKKDLQKIDIYIGSSGKSVGDFLHFYISGNIQVSIFSLRYSSSLKP